MWGGSCCIPESLKGSRWRGPDRCSVITQIAFGWRHIKKLVTTTLRPLQLYESSAAVNGNTITGERKWGLTGSSGGGWGTGGVALLREKGVVVLTRVTQGQLVLQWSTHSAGCWSCEWWRDSTRGGGGGGGKKKRLCQLVSQRHPHEHLWRGYYTSVERTQYIYKVENKGKVILFLGLVKLDLSPLCLSVSLLLSHLNTSMWAIGDKGKRKGRGL